MSMLGRVDFAGQGIIEGARQNARRRRLADAAHAREDIGLVNAARGEGIGERAHHRLLADEVFEAHRPVFSRQHPIGRGRRRGLQLRRQGRANRSTTPSLGRKRSMAEHLKLCFRSMDRRSGRRRTQLTLAWSLTAQARQWEVGQRPALAR